MTIAKQLKIKDFPFEIRDRNDKIIYVENSDGSWQRREYDANGNNIFYEDSNGVWAKREYDANGKQISEEGGEKL